MDLLHFFRWLGSLPVARALNDSEWLFPAVESVHITGLALRDRPAAQLARDLRYWTWAGIGIMLTTGPTMLSAEPERGYGNPAFAFKMSCLLLALVTHFTIHRHATRPGPALAATLGEKLAACLSLALWTGV